MKANKGFTTQIDDNIFHGVRSKLVQQGPLRDP